MTSARPERQRAFHYRAFALPLKSSFPLPGLAPAPAGRQALGLLLASDAQIIWRSSRQGFPMGAERTLSSPSIRGATGPSRFPDREPHLGERASGCGSVGGEPHRVAGTSRRRGCRAALPPDRRVELADANEFRLAILARDEIRRSRGRAAPPARSFGRHGLQSQRLPHDPHLLRSPEWSAHLPLELRALRRAPERGTARAVPTLVRSARTRALPG